MTFERTRDYALVRAIVTHPQVYPWMLGDGAPAPEEFRPDESESIWYMLVRDAGELLGLFMAVPLTNVCVELHTCLLPAGRGARAFEAYRAGLAWLWANTGTEKVIGNIPAYNRAALRIALRAGCAVIGVNRNAQRKFGKLQDIVIVGIGRNEQHG